MTTWEFALLMVAIIAIVVTVAWLRVRLPRIGSGREQKQLDEIREQYRGKPFDRITTIQREWQE